MSEFDTHDDTPQVSGRSSAEVDDADAYEQYRHIVDESDAAADVPDGVDPADAYEQRLVIGEDDDEYDDR